MQPQWWGDLRKRRRRRKQGGLVVFWLVPLAPLAQSFAQRDSSDKYQNTSRLSPCLSPCLKSFSASGVDSWLPHCRLETRMSRQAIYQLHQALKIFTTHRREFQTHSASRLCVPHSTGGPDRTFLDKKVKPEHRSHGQRFLCRDKQTSQAQVPDSCSILKFFIAPLDQDPLACLDSLVAPSPRSNSMLQDVFIGVHVRPPLGD